jgi:hypothetical protein
MVHGLQGLVTPLHFNGTDQPLFHTEIPLCELVLLHTEVEFEVVTQIHVLPVAHLSLS